MADVTKAIEPKSDQLNAEDMLGGPRTFTIARVTVRDSPDQPISVHLAEGPSGRPWKPAKTMAKLMRLAWTAESDNWVGNRVTLYNDPEIMFGPNKMGGIRISHMSGIGRKPLTANLAATRGRRVLWTVQPLSDDAPPAKVPGPMDQLVWAMNAAGLRDKVARLDYCRSVIQREGIVNATDLTPDEVATVIAALKAAERPSAADVAPSADYVESPEERDERLQAEAFEREQEARQANG